MLAESSRCQLLFEGTFGFPRYYIPREDVRVELSVSGLHTTCAYKGHATHYSARPATGGELPNIGWSYDEPLEVPSEYGAWCASTRNVSICGSTVSP